MRIKFMAIFNEAYCNELLYSQFDEEFSNFEMTAETVNRICESCKGIKYSLAEQYILEAATPKCDLSRFGIKNAPAQVSKASNEIAKTIKTNGVNSETTKKIHNIISDLFKDLADSIDETIISADHKLKDLDDKRNVAKAITLFIFNLVINTICANVLGLLLGQFGLTLVVCLTGPLIEEACKAIAVKGGFSKEFTIVFNAYEFTSYVTQNAIVYGLIRIVKIRLAALTMHLVNTAIHNLAESKEFKGKLGIKEDDKDANDKCTFAAYIITSLIHVSWNSAIGSIICANIH